MKVIGHKKQKELLKKMAGSGNIPHNLLFVGQEAVGKKKTAEEFFKLLNCDKSEACGECPSCRDIEAGRHSDLLIIEEDSEIKIDQVREIQKRLSLTGRSENSYKGVIIDRAHLLNSQAQACLLKTLEEPKGKTLIILVTEHPNILLDTILSRMWQVKFSPVESGMIKGALISMGADEDKAERITRISFSKPGLAVRFLNDDKFRKERTKKEKDLEELRKSCLGERFDYVKKLAKEKSEARETLKVWLSILRKEMIESEDEKAGEIKEALESIEKVLFLTSKTNVNLKLSLEEVVINL